MQNKDEKYTDKFIVISEKNGLKGIWSFNGWFAIVENNVVKYKR